MSVYFAGRACLDPAQEATNCRELGYALGPWVSDANGFTCPLGQAPGRGRVLMRRGDLDTIDREALHDLVFRDGANAVTVKSLLIVRAVAITPGYRSDPNTAYWVEIADKRYLCRGVPIDQAFNVRSSPSGDYYSATLNGGVAWTWAGMAQTIWTAVGKLGTWPGLPFTPDGTPEGFSFYGGRAYDALGQVLDRIGCALRLDPTTGTLTVVRIGATDATAELALTALERSRVWDDEPLDPVRARVPASARVLFRRQRITPDLTGGSPFYTVDVADPSGTLAGAESGTYVVLYDDLPATYDSAGSLTNAAALATRAADRAADYFRRVRLSRLRRTFSGAHASAGLLPGPQVKATRWSERAGLGVLTEVFRDPGTPAPQVPYALGGPSPVPEGGDTFGGGVAFGGTDVIFPPQSEPTFVEGGYSSDASDRVEYAYPEGLTVQNDTGALVFSGVHTLQFDSTGTATYGSFTLDLVADGTVRPRVYSATADRAGVVNTSGQTFRGTKQFDGIDVYDYDRPADSGNAYVRVYESAGVCYFDFDYWVTAGGAGGFRLVAAPDLSSTTFLVRGHRYGITIGATTYLGGTATVAGIQFAGGLYVGGTYTGIDDIDGDDGTSTGLTLGVSGTPPNATLTLGGTLGVLSGGTSLATPPPAGSMLTGNSDGTGYSQSRATTFLYRWGTD